MPENIRALIVVLALSAPAFYIGRQLALGVISPREFAAWRNVWFAVTIAAFLSGSFPGSFLVFAVIETMICLYARATRSATPALFVMLLLAVPLINVPIGGFGFFNSLLDINNGRLLAIVLLLPMLFVTGGSGRRKSGVYSMPDSLIIGYVLLLIILNSENVSQAVRATAIASLDVLIPYFVFSRMVTNVADLRRVALAFIIAVLPLSLIGIFEASKGWLLYSSFVWRDDLMMRYLERGGVLRPNASAGGSIVLGFIIMVAIGCMLAVRQSMGSRTYSGIAFAILGAGLIASLSRGPWVGTTVLVLVYLAISPNAIANLARLVVIGAAVLLPLLLTPIGSRLLDLLPFIGTVDAGSVTYRQHLFDNAILVIERNPWFGSIDFRSTPEMQEMMQGQHIIDVVNTYLEIALNSGLVGLGFFLAIFATILVGMLRVHKFEIVRKMGLGAYVHASMATLVAMLVTIGTVSFIDYIPYAVWSFAGLCVALIRIAYQERAALVRANTVQVPA